MRNISGLIVFVTFFLPLCAYAQEEMGVTPAPPQLSGYLGLGYWSGSRNLDDKNNFGVSRFTGKTESRINHFSSFLVEGTVWNQDAFNGDGNTRGEFREAWINVEATDSTEFRLGKQLMTWGRADGINPTDLINARDFTRLVPDDIDQKLGTWSFKGTQYFGKVSATALWLLDFEPNRIPIPSLGSGTTVAEERPKDNGHRQGAAKIEITGGQVDASVSYFDGFDRTPDLRMNGSVITLYYPRIKVVGVDAAKNLGRFGFRAEASYTFQDNKETSALPPRQDALFIVLGVDRSFFEYLNINVQYIGRYLKNFSDPELISDPGVRAFAVLRGLLIQQYAKEQHGMSARIAHKWFHETLEVELKGLTWFANSDYVLSPRITYAVNDRLKITLGADIYRGPDNSPLGLLEKNTTGFSELKWSF